MLAMVGLANCASARRPIEVCSSYARWASAFERCCSNWLMSAPETKARVPAPVSTTVRIASSAGEVFEHFGEAEPHLDGHGVVLLGLIERDDSHAVACGRQDLAARVLAHLHVTCEIVHPHTCTPRAGLHGGTTPESVL